MNQKKKRVRKPVESPRNPFDAAKMIYNATKNLTPWDRDKAVRWALEYNGMTHPIRIESNAKYT